MREKDRQLSRRRHRRLKRLKQKGQEDHQLRTERAAGSKRTPKKTSPGPAEAAGGIAGPAEVPSDTGKKPAAKKAPAKKAPAKKAPAPVEKAEEGAEGGAVPEEPKEP